MPLDLDCPKCRHVFPVTEARHPVGVECPGCAAELTAEFRRLPVPTPGQPHYELLVSVGRPPGSAAPPPAAKARKGGDDDEKRRKGGSMGVVVLAGLGALTVTLGGLGAVGYVLFTNMDPPPEVTYHRPGPGGNRPGPGPGPGPNNPPPKKVEKFSLKPAYPAGPPITSYKLAADPLTVDLGGKVGALSVGGGGLYAVMHFPNEGRLKVFDLARGAVLTEAPADSGEVKLAAGQTRAVVCAAGDVLRVYAVPDLVKKFDAPSPHTGLRSIAMGCRTNGPLLTVGTFGRVVLVELTADGVKEVEGSAAEPGVHWNHLRASGDGLAYATFDGFNGNRVKLLTEAGGRWKLQDLDQVPFPGSDGYWYGNGVISNKSGTTQPVGVGSGSNHWAVPATSGPYHAKAVLGTGPPSKRVATVTFHRNRSDAPAAATPASVDVPEWGNRLPQPLDQHLFFVPEAKVLAVLNTDRTKITLRRVDVR